VSALPHPRDGQRTVHSAEVLEAQYEENLDCAGIEREAGLMVTAAHAIFTVRELERRLREYERWEAYVVARHEYIVDREQHARKQEAA